MNHENTKFSEIFFVVSFFHDFVMKKKTSNTCPAVAFFAKADPTSNIE